MSTGVTVKRIAQRSPRLKARMAGLFYLLTGGTAFAFFVRGKLVVPDDAAATATNILAHERLFRTALAADLIGVACYVVVTALFYELFRPVNRNLSLLATFFSLVGCAVQVFACVFHLGALVALGSAQPVGAFNVEQLQALALMSLKLHGQAFSVAILFFGLYCFLIGYLIFRSTFLPRILGVLMAVGGLAYVTNSVAGFLSLPIAKYLSSYATFLGGLGEGLLMLWLLVMGVNAQLWREQAGKSGA